MPAQPRDKSGPRGGARASANTTPPASDPSLDGAAQISLPTDATATAGEGDVTAIDGATDGATDGGAEVIVTGELDGADEVVSGLATTDGGTVLSDSIGGTARISGLEALGESEASLSQVEIPLGVELLCANFESGPNAGSLMAGKVIEVRDGGAELLLDNGWKWPVSLERINLAQGEWRHEDSDYPPLGEDDEFDRAHRMSEEQRTALAEAAQEEARAAARLAERVAQGEELVKAARAVEQETRIANAASARERPAHSFLATWKGPGAYAGPWVRESDHRELDMAQAGARGFFPARSVEMHASQFEIHPS